MQSDSKQQEECFERIVYIFTPTNQGLMKGLITTQAIEIAFFGNEPLYCA